MCIRDRACAGASVLRTARGGSTSRRTCRACARLCGRAYSCQKTPTDCAMLFLRDKAHFHKSQFGLYVTDHAQYAMQGICLACENRNYEDWQVMYRMRQCARVEGIRSTCAIKTRHTGVTKVIGIRRVARQCIECGSAIESKGYAPHVPQ